jgi:hypothetical protein
MYMDINSSILSKVSSKRGLVFGLMIYAALIAFELFNYGTTEYALQDLIGDLNFLGVSWSTILAIAFCGIDFAGIARIFTPERGEGHPAELWYLFAAWILAALMNALLTWWGVSIAILNHASLGNMLVERSTLLKVVPVFVAVMVWLIRVLTIGTLSLAGDKLFSQAAVLNRQSARSPQWRTHVQGAIEPPPQPSRLQELPLGFNPAPKSGSLRGEPTYRPVSMSGRRQG